jgi:glycosyltransferase involved in cell wall biosynthesis
VSDLVVFSHLRWVFVWQRPQHLISRLARTRRTWFVEEPEPADVREPTLCSEEHGRVTRVWLEVPVVEHRHVDFGDPDAACYGEALRALIGTQRGRAAWLYTPMAFDLAAALEPEVLAYDVMDDLASFRGAPAALRFLQQQTLRRADVVFAGGRSLHRSVASRRPDAHLFPSGVEPEHYAVSGAPRPAHARPVAGYVGVIDERLDLELIAELAATLPDWEIRLVGPVLKIDESTLPQAPNITYPGPQPYERLPQVMSEFDVGLMPFALNEATASISPTKTLEYLAAGLPVVSTRVPDVVADYGDVVALAEDAESFAAACPAALAENAAARRDRIAPILRLHHWDAIAARMDALLRAAPARRVEPAGEGRVTSA